MKNLYSKADVTEAIQRIERLNSNSQRQWGTMTPAQMMAHVNISIEMASGKHHLKRVGFIGRIIGSMIKPKVLNEKPFGKNSPTAPDFIFTADLHLEEQRSKAISTIRSFHEGGPGKCTTHPHPFFGHFTPEQWAIFQWKHLDHHLRQFGV
jgi:hypothetical protein